MAGSGKQPDGLEEGATKHCTWVFCSQYFGRCHLLLVWCGGVRQHGRNMDLHLLQ